MDAAQVQAGGIGLSAQLCRGDDKGLRCGLRRLGYELHVGGSGGIKVRVTDLLCKVETEGGPRVLRCLHPAVPRGGALPRTHSTLGRRVGLNHIKQQVLEDEANRKALRAFPVRPEVRPDRPWKARAEGSEALVHPLKKIA